MRIAAGLFGVLVIITMLLATVHYTWKSKEFKIDCELLKGEVVGNKCEFKE